MANVVVLRGTLEKREATGNWVDHTVEVTSEGRLRYYPFDGAVRSVALASLRNVEHKNGMLLLWTDARRRLQFRQSGDGPTLSEFEREVRRIRTPKLMRPPPRTPVAQDDVVARLEARLKQATGKRFDAAPVPPSSPVRNDNDLALAAASARLEDARRARLATDVAASPSRELLRAAAEALGRATNRDEDDDDSLLDVPRPDLRYEREKSARKRAAALALATTQPDGL